MSYLRFFAFAVLAGLGGCVSPVGMQPHVAPASPVFDPVAFFAGKTHGTGVLHVIASRPRHTDVVGYGTSPGPEAIMLDQQVNQGDAAATHRTWHLHRIAPGRYAGTLTDAIGPVTAESAGAELTIRFTMRHGFEVVQHLYLQSGGRTAVNTMTVRKWGIVVAHLDERIERI